MKKTLRISLVALFAAIPMMAMAAVGDPVAGEPVAQGTQTDAQVTTTVTPKFAVATSAATDVNAASAGYVKGAYNAAIRAVNTVYADLDSKISGKQAALSAGSGIDITNNKVSAALTAKGGLKFDGTGDSATIGVLVDSGTMEKDSSTGALKVKSGVFDAAGAAGAVETKLTTSTPNTNGYDINAKSLKVNGATVLTAHQDISGKIDKSAISSALSSASTNTQVAGAKAAYDAIKDAKTQAISAAQSGMATQSGVVATVNAATASVSGVSLGVNFGTITTNTSALKVSVPTKASYSIMQTWGSDSATSGTYSLSNNTNASVSGTATTTIGATTATGSISGIDVSVDSYKAQ